ncbi:MAG: PAS domain S-box protein [Planctomycetota bacterium]
MRSKLVWKLSAVVVAILTVAIALSGYMNNLICAHYSLESARAFLKFNSESIIKGIGQLMMSRNIEGTQELIVEISRDSKVYGDIRLVSHRPGRYGEVVASRFGRDESGPELSKLEVDDRACVVCHPDPNDFSIAKEGIIDDLIDRPEGSRVLSVMAPILNEPGCRTADCHAHFDSPPILGFLNADYSLDRVDSMVTDRRILILITVLVSLLLGIVALWFMFARLLERPISGLIAGTERIAANQLDFRFDQKRNDEIGMLEESFNTMTARIQAHRDELRSAMEYLGGIVENSADLIITVTPEGFIETFNRGAEQALGYSRAEVIGRQIEMLFVDPREREAAITRLEDTDNVRNYETRFLAKDGQVRNVLLTLSRLRDRQGEPIGTMGISKDVTQEKNLQRELVHSQKFAAIGQAVTGIQHAIKNMLNALKGGAYLVRNGMAKDNRQRVEEGWAMVEEGIDRISDLSHNMLNYAKEWKLELHREDLNGLVAKICGQNQRIAAEREVALRCEAPGGLPAVLCDPKLIHMAVTDILVNAVDACAWKDYDSGESPEVVLENSLGEGGDSVVIEVRDNGCGMNEEIRRSIFTPFFSTKKTRGTGLGLALTARIINVHGGKISVESEPDRGTVCCIYLPVDGPKDNRETIDGQASTLS